MCCCITLNIGLYVDLKHIYAYPRNHIFCISWFGGGSEPYSLKVSLGVSLGNEMQMLRCFGHAQMWHIKHISVLEQIHQTLIRCVCNCLSDIGFFGSQHLLAFIGVCDWNRPPTAELDCHDLQNGRDDQNQSMNFYNLCMRSIMLVKCLTKCLVQTATAPRTWSDHVINLLLFCCFRLAL